MTRVRQKQNKSQRQRLEFTERRKRVAAGYIQGLTQSELAARFGVDQSTISRDLEAIRQEWLKEAIFDFSEAKARELIKIDNLESTNWDRFEASGRTARKWLVGVQWCIEQRCKILGLYAPQRRELTGADGKPIEYRDLTELSDEELARIAAGKEAFND